MWLIPGKTKVKTEIFKGVSFTDVFIGLIAGVIFVVLLMSNLPHKFVISIVLFFVTALLIVRIDAEPNYVFLMHMFRYLGYPKRFVRVKSDETLVAKHAGEHEGEEERLRSETKAEKKKRQKAKKAEQKAERKAGKTGRKATHYLGSG